MPGRVGKHVSIVWSERRWFRWRWYWECECGLMGRASSEDAASSDAIEHRTSAEAATL